MILALKTCKFKCIIRYDYFLTLFMTVWHKMWTFENVPLKLSMWWLPGKGVGGGGWGQKVSYQYCFLLSRALVLNDRSEVRWCYNFITIIYKQLLFIYSKLMWFSCSRADDVYKLCWRQELCPRTNSIHIAQREHLNNYIHPRTGKYYKRWVTFVYTLILWLANVNNTLCTSTPLYGLWIDYLY